MSQHQVDIKTPEYVSLTFQPAGLGSRTAALLIDHIILTILNIAIIAGLFILLIDMPLEFYFMYDFMSYQIAITIIGLFILNWGYFFALEFFNGGRTIGKKMIGIRVIQENGHSITLLSSFIRNFLRIIDSLPANYLVGMLMIFFHQKNKRVGDLVAGTIVIHERKRKKSKKKTIIQKEIEKRGLKKADIDIDEWTLKAFSEKDWKLAKTYTQRLHQLTENERNELTIKIGEILLPKIGQSKEGKTIREIEDLLLLVYLYLRDEWEFEL
ncbi:RDD family protein [Bacillus weihaiensis]|uniref:RDD domain-containing protein n=1 Tax=Bacillus weihaiensis TaxID=1547283 RepID=A0A1L3MNV5_9BACI|nr:RDD family protein [Bacillus weihaiensis]APH04000.1 hypothetical protein A9C19_04200 [Bacillus weihaiensis]